MGSNQTKQTEPKNIKATIIYSNGDRYEGEILDNRRNGFGTYFYSSGERYQGMWENNLKHGRGTMFFNNEEIYEGWWNSNMREGVGTLFYPNGDRYYGEWKDNKKNGKGIFHFNDGTKFIGQFKLNKKHGVGEIVDLNKEKLTEEWKEGKLYKRYDKPKTREKGDFLKFDTEQLQRYLDSKSNQQVEPKNVQMKSKYLSLEIAKMLRSKNLDNLALQDANKALNQELLMIKPNILQWKVEDVSNWFKNFDLEKYSEILFLHNIDGSKLMNMEASNLITLFNAVDKYEINLITLSFDLLKNIKKEADHTKSMRSFKSIKKGNDQKYLNFTSNNHLKSINYNKKIASIKEVEDINQDNNSINESLVDTKINAIDINLKEESKDVVVSKIKQTYSPSQTISSSLNLMGLSFYINFEELTLQTKVGEGGFGEVFLGNWNGKKIAVKKLSVKHYKNSENFYRFFNEINIISSLRHPNIVLYIGASIDKDDYYMITEYLPRGSLFDYMRKEKSKFTEREQINIAYEMAVALNYLHSRSVVHCDLKSSNILIDDNWKIKIGDFGLSQFIKENEYNRGKIGTPHWMAPEILKGGIYEYSSDVYSFGMILWEILKMEIPYYGLNPYQIYNLVVKDKKIVEIPDEGHEVLLDIIKRCLNYEPSKRPSLKEIVNTLEKLKSYNKNIDTNFEELYDFLY